MKNRWVILAAGCLIQTILGGIYAWSTFVPYLMEGHGLNAGQCGLIFGLAILSFTSSMILAGRILIKKGPRFTAVISAVLFMCGYLIASFCGGSFPLLLLTLGIIVGSGIGFGYVCPLSVGMKWFPDKKGLVTGVAVAGFGAGAVVLASLAEYYLLKGIDVMEFFRWFGVCSGIALFLAAMILADPPAPDSVRVTTQQTPSVLSLPFILSCVGLFAGTFGGLLIIGNLAPLVIKAGLTVKQAALCISVFAVGNGLGRIAWGKIFDLIGYPSIPLSLASFAVVSGMLLLPLPDWSLVLTVAMIGFFFGSNFVIYASTITRFFGIDAFPRVYPYCFMAYGIAGITGPALGGYLADTTGTYDTALYICITLVSLAGVFTAVKLGVFKQETKVLVEKPA